MPLFRRSYAAEDLSESWRIACLKAMGLEGWQVVDRSNDYSDPSSASKFQVINLLHPPDEAEEEGSSLDSNHRDDPWMQTAVQIESNIREMATWIRRKQREYVKLDTPDEEASLIQSTVTSFTATTANEIESLHQCVAINLKSNSAQQQKQQHCAGIVQILMVELKENVAEPFGRLSKQRHRAAVQLWQTPLQCRLWTPTTTARRTTTMSKNEKETLELLGLDDESEQSLATTKMTDQRFQPVRASHRLHRDFLQSYERTKGPTNSKLLRPPSLFRSDTSDNEPKFEGHISSSYMHTIRRQCNRRIRISTISCLASLMMITMRAMRIATMLLLCNRKRFSCKPRRTVIWIRYKRWNRPWSISRLCSRSLPIW